MEKSIPESGRKLSLPRFVLSLFIPLPGLQRPKEAFTQLVQTGRPHPALAALALYIVIWLGAVITLPVTMREATEGYDKMLEQTSENFPEEQRAILEQQREFASNPLVLVASQGITQSLAYPILWVSAAGLLYLLCLAFGGQTRFGSIFSMVIWASAAETLGKIVLVAGTLLSGKTPDPGLSYLVSTENLADVTPVTAGLSQILAKITLFDIWYLVLIGVGIAVCAKLPRGKSAVITILYWILSLIIPTALALGSAAINQSMFG